LLNPVATYFLKYLSHQKYIINYEIIYFQILCIGAFPSIASVSLSSFFSGQGRTKIVLFVSSLQTFSHLILDYLLIFGKFIFPEMGIKGAGIATIISGFLSFFIYLFLFLNKREEIYNVKDFKFDKELFNELLKFGVPNGVYYFLDISVWTIFLLIIGKLGITPLSSTNIAFNVNTVAFMPMLGIGTGVSILIGNYIGENKKDEGEKIAFIGFFITFIYMFLIALSYVLIPDFYIKFFKPKIYIENFEEVRKLTIILLRFVAFYSLFDTMNIIFISALRGAGDTKFIMNTFLSTSLFLIPLYILIFFFSANVFIAWIIATFYVIINGIIFFIRFLKGSWKKIDLMKIERGIYGR
jgi:MATE family multidrug resistance protein